MKIPELDPFTPRLKRDVSRELVEVLGRADYPAIDVNSEVVAFGANLAILPAIR